MERWKTKTFNLRRRPELFHVGKTSHWVLFSRKDVFFTKWKTSFQLIHHKKVPLWDPVTQKAVKILKYSKYNGSKIGSVYLVWNQKEAVLFIVKNVLAMWGRCLILWEQTGEKQRNNIRIQTAYLASQCGFDPKNYILAECRALIMQEKSTNTGNSF